MRAWLHEKGVELEERDFFQDQLTEKDLRKLLGAHHPSELFSWKSPSFRTMGLDAERLSDTDLVRLMLQEPRLIRRPLVQVDDRLIIGADRHALDEAFNTGC